MSEGITTREVMRMVKVFNVLEADGSIKKSNIEKAKGVINNRFRGKVVFSEEVDEEDVEDGCLAEEYEVYKVERDVEEDEEHL